MQEQNLISKKKNQVSGNTLILMHFDNNWRNEAGDSPFATGNLVTSNFRFGVGSATFPSGSFARFQPKPEYTGVTEATIEFWWYKTANQTWGSVIAQGTSPTNYSGLDCSGYNGYDLGFVSYNAAGAQVIVPIIAVSKIPLNAWSHIAAVWKDGKVTGFVNGVKQLEGIMEKWFLRSGMTFDLGNVPYANSFPILGNLDDFRFSGKALYSDPFDPPTGPFTS